jgi:hypothetical protein
MRHLLVFLLVAVSSYATTIPEVAPFPEEPRSCIHTAFFSCYDGCHKFNCGGIDGGVRIGFEMERPGAIYSTCSETGNNCGSGFACQTKRITLTFKDCNGNTVYFDLEPCCEAGGWWESTLSTPACIAEDSLLPIPVRSL